MTHVAIPQDLAEAAASEGREEWLARLPAVVSEVADRWQLELGPPFEPSGRTAWVAPACDMAGTELALKVCWAHEEALHEADGLAAWDGAGAVRLQRAERKGDATVLLLERCVPGTQLRTRAPEEHDVVIAALLRQLWISPPPGHPFRPLSDMCDYWADCYEERRVGRRALDKSLGDCGIALLRELPRSAETAVLLHTDLHAGNVLAATREPWLAIDPKPYVGDPAYDVTQHIFNGVFIEGAQVRPLASRMAALLDLDLDRVLRWLFARAVEASGYWDGMADLARDLAPR